MRVNFKLVRNSNLGTIEAAAGDSDGNERVIAEREALARC
jgi:hypothetical protein